MPRRNANPQTTPKGVYFSVLKAKRSDCDNAERQRNRTKFMLIEYCFVGLKNTFPCYVVLAAGTAGGERETDRDSEDKKKMEIAKREWR